MSQSITEVSPYGFVWKCCVPLHPMVLLIIIPTKWLFHWEYTQHFQTYPYVTMSIYVKLVMECDILRHPHPAALLQAFKQCGAALISVGHQGMVQSLHEISLKLPWRICETIQESGASIGIFGINNKQSLIDIHWYPLISIDIHWYPLISIGIHWYPLILSFYELRPSESCPAMGWAFVSIQSPQSRGRFWWDGPCIVRSANSWIQGGVQFHRCVLITLMAWRMCALNSYINKRRTSCQCCQLVFDATLNSIGPPPSWCLQHATAATPNM